MNSNADVYRCWKCGKPVPHEPNARHECSAQVPPTVTLDRIAALEQRMLESEREIDRLRALVNKGFIGVKRLSDQFVVPACF